MVTELNIPFYQVGLYPGTANNKFKERKKLPLLKFIGLKLYPFRLKLVLGLYHSNFHLFTNLSSQLSQHPCYLKHPLRKKTSQQNELFILDLTLQS